MKKCPYHFDPCDCYNPFGLENDLMIENPEDNKPQLIELAGWTVEKLQHLNNTMANAGISFHGLLSLVPNSNENPLQPLTPEEVTAFSDAMAEPSDTIPDEVEYSVIDYTDSSDIKELVFARVEDAKRVGDALRDLHKALEEPYEIDLVQKTLIARWDGEPDEA